MPTKIVKTKFELYGESYESMTEVSTNSYEPLPPNDQLKHIGKPVDRYDGYEKATGSAIYAFDKVFPKLTHARILRSPIPHANIVSIDISKAKKLRGVLSIITHKDISDIKWWGGSTLLFDTHLRYQGDEIACVVAETEAIAKKALNLIEVEYEELDFVVDPTEAMNTNAPHIHEGGNIRNGEPARYSRGDVDAGLAEADITFEDTFKTQVQIHHPLEVHCSTVNWDGDLLTVYDSTQALFNVRDQVANALDIPKNKVRVIKHYMGGGFGSKLEGGKYTVMAAILAEKIGRPVKITVDRREMALAHGNRPDSVQSITAGVKKDGTLTALKQYSYGAVGAYPNAAGASWPLRALYKCDNVDVEEYSVFTNAGRARAFRAPGHVQGTFALESFIDELAEKVGLDPLEFRMKNYAETEQTTQLPFTSKLLKECYEEGAKAIGWKEKRNPSGSYEGRYKTGIGMASQIWWGGGTPPSHTMLKLNSDGSANIMCGTQDIGTGTKTFMQQVVAEILEIPLDKVTVLIGDTGTMPYSVLSGGSLTAPSVSPAVRDACEKMIQKIISVGAIQLETDESNIRYSDGVIYKKDDETQKLSLPELLGKLWDEKLVTTGMRERNPDGYYTNTFGAQFAEVEVDSWTGKIKIHKIVAAHDIGRVLNLKTCANQIHGGVMQGIGYALMEERILDTYTGKMVNTNFYDYKIPTVMDTPDIEAIFVSEGDELLSNTGVKGVGEPATIPTSGAIANAIYNALGVRIKELPITPDKILHALMG